LVIITLILDIVVREQGPVIHPWSRYWMAPFSLIVLLSEG
jgi:hypothetical protein